MDIEAHIRKRAEDLSRSDVDHAQPWLKHLIGHGRFLTAASERVDDKTHAEAIAKGFGILTRLKPDGGAREIVHVPVEADVLMARQSRDLVPVLDRHVRRPVSYAARARYKRGEWCLERWGRERGGTYRQYCKGKQHIEDEHPFVAHTDVRRYFPSLSWSGVVTALGSLSGLEEGDILAAMALHGRIWYHADALELGMPAGCDLSNVVGAALLSGCDDELIATVGEQAVVRWMDDMTFGVLRPDQASEVLDRLRRGPLTALHLGLHPHKTRLEPSRSFLREDDYVDVDDGDQDVEPADLDEVRRLRDIPPGAVLPRKETRPLLKAVLHVGDEAADVIASRAGIVLAGNSGALPDKLKKASGGVHIVEALTDNVLASLVHDTTPGSPADGEASELLVGLQDVADAGRAGRKALRTLATDPQRVERTRAVATWWLADRFDDFPREALDQLPQLSPSCARGVLTAAHRAGARLTTSQWECGALAA